MMGFIKSDKGSVAIHGLDAWKDAAKIKKMVGYIPGQIDFPDVGTGTAFLKIQADMLVCLAMGGVCFMFSGIFNQSKYSVAFSGTFVGVSILANMMAMFGSLGVDALENFKYASICTLYDYNSVIADTDTWIIKGAVALGIAVVSYAIGSIRFCKKDLPL